MLASAAILRYLKSDGKIHQVVFNNLQLADSQRHRVLLRLTNLQRGPGSVELYMDCTQVDSAHSLPRAFADLAQNPKSLELRTFQGKAQVGTSARGGLPHLGKPRRVLRTAWQLRHLLLSGHLGDPRPP